MATATNKVEERLKTWFGQCLYVADTESLTKFVLYHLGSKTKDEIWEEEYEQDAIGADDYARIILLEAEADAESVSGLQSYALGAFYGRRKSPSRKHRFRIQGTDDLDVSHEHSETGDSTGLVKQAHRHLEATMKIALGSVEGAMRRQDRQLALQEMRLERAENRHIEVIKLQEELLSQRQERELETLRAMNREKHIDDIVGTVKMGMPILINRVGGKKLLPETTTPKEMALNAFFDTIDPEQLTKLVSSDILSKSQLMVIMTLINDRVKDAAE